MIKDCNTKNPLLRDGTSQQQRLLKALLPSYVSVDERSMQDLIDFAVNYGKEINYYDSTNTINGDWQSFFKDMVIDEAGQTTQPHYALFIAFLQLFRIAQDDLNTITQRHLDFYYRDVLRLEEHDAVPDQVYVIFKLAQQVVSHLVPQGTALNAKKDATGKSLVYDTTREIVVNTAQVAELKALFYNTKYDQRLYASPMANSADGIGKELEGDEKKWKTFGSLNDPALPFNSPAIDRTQADVGFAFASPVLQLAEGSRKVTITLTFNTTNIRAIVDDADLKTAFKVFFSGEKEWIVPAPDSAVDEPYISGTNSIVITRIITQAQPAVVNYNKAVLKSPFSTSWPVAKIVLNTDDSASPYVYNKLKSLVLTNAQLKVKVIGVKNLVLQNDQSKLDASKPFQPFGNRPVVSSSFYIGSAELFSKSLSSVDIDITWKGLPVDDRGFEDYYHNYIPESENQKRKNPLFKAEVSILKGKDWKILLPAASDGARLFDTASIMVEAVEASTAVAADTFSARSSLLLRTPLSNKRLITANSGTLSSIGRDPQMALTPLTKLDNSTFRGFLRMELAVVDFGHQDFQNSFALQALKAAKAPGSPGPTIDDYPLPNEPYTPVISELSLNYESTVNIPLVNNTSVNDEGVFNDRIDQFFHIEPFGVAENHPFINVEEPNISLLPVYKDQGSLYIGISDLHPSQTLSILFKVAEGSADPDLHRATVEWSYMVNNEWKPFPPLKILSDSTNGLLTSGIIVFDISKFATNTNTVLTPGLHWLKASAVDNSSAVCELIDLRTQAVSAAFVDKGNDPNHLLQSLPAETITELLNSDGAIEKVIQPYASFGGKIKEQSNEFYTRVSERLRHKNRAVNIWDYEHLILEKFPTIYKAKCLNHTKYISVTDIKEMAPGHVSVVMISDLKNKNAVNPLKPKTSLVLLTEIEEFIKTLNPPAVELYIKNPLYEEVSVEFNVRFLPGYDNGFYGQKLEEDIKKFLAPWAYNVSDISFGGKIHKSMILNFVEEQPYVDFVTCFKMNQLISGNLLLNIDEAVASTSASIITSAASHSINVLDSDECECDDNLVAAPYAPTGKSCDCDCDCGHGTTGGSGSGSGSGTGGGPTPNPNPYGIGVFEVGDTFIVGNGGPYGNNGIDFMQIDIDFEIE
ncbi:MAG: hypothetical protein JWO09_2788 [Bacteroidetes bacterium]|nr:hypothetical protein [Bacteroidota bacterium]